MPVPPKPGSTEALLASMGQVKGGVLANARASSRPVMTEQAVAAGVAETLTCPGCGAPRVQGDQGYVCAYCGTTLR